MSTVTHIGPGPDYCCYCYGEARKAGRVVRDVNGRRMCGLCENRQREGLIHYRPSNGTEGEMFEGRCGRCKHRLDDDGSNVPSLDKPTMCAWGVLDRLTLSGWHADDSIANWYDPADLEKGCPATCKRFTRRGQDGGEPPLAPDPNQLTFDDLNVPVELPAEARKVTVKA